MELGFSEEQIMLKDMVRKLCDQHAPLSVLREVEGKEPGYSASLWQQLGDLGLTGIGVSESHGGLNMGALDSALVAEEFGRALAVSPHHVSSVLAADLLAGAATDKQKAHWLAAIASGSGFVTVASAEPGSSTAHSGIQLRAQHKGDMLVLDGEKRFVPFAGNASAVLVLARDESSQVVGLLLPRDLMDAAGESLVSSYQVNLAGDPLYKMRFRGFQVPGACLLNKGQCIWDQWQGSMTRALVPLAAYAVGAAERVHEISVDYARYREAFGRPIGGFQAIAHYLAEVAVAIEGARTLVHQASWFQDQGRNAKQLALMAKLQACETFRRAAAVCIQVHGGIGYTTEADPQLFFRRAKQLQTLNWDPGALEHAIADTLFAESA